MGKTIGVISIKGGVGKTTTVVNLGSVLASEFNKKVLIVDGINNHDWRNTTIATKAILEQTGRFTVFSGITAKRELQSCWYQWLTGFVIFQNVKLLKTS